MSKVAVPFFQQQAMFYYKGKSIPKVQVLHHKIPTVTDIRHLTTDLATAYRIGRCIDGDFCFPSLKYLTLKDVCTTTSVKGDRLKQLKASLEARKAKLTAFITIVGPAVTFPPRFVHPYNYANPLKSFITNHSPKRKQRVKLIFEEDGNVVIAAMENMGKDLFKQIKVRIGQFSTVLHEPQGYSFEGFWKYTNVDAPEWED